MKPPIFYLFFGLFLDAINIQNVFSVKTKSKMINEKPFSTTTKKWSDFVFFVAYNNHNNNNSQFFSLPSFINLYVLSFVICCLWSHLVSISSSDNKTKKNENVQCFLTRLVGVKHIHKEFFFRCCRYSFENCFAKMIFLLSQSTPTYKESIF